MPVHLAPALQHRLPAAAQESWPVHEIVVVVALLSTVVPQVWTPAHSRLHVLGVPVHFSSLQPCRPGQLMSQLLAWQTMGSVEQAFSPEQATVQALPAQSTPLRQLESPQVMSHEDAWLQSTALSLQPLLLQLTRQGMPAGQCGAQPAPLHAMTQVEAMQVPPAALQSAESQGGGPEPPLPPLPPALAPPPPMLTAPATPPLPPPPAFPPLLPPLTPPLAPPLLLPALEPPAETEPPLSLPALCPPVAGVPAVGLEPPTGSWSAMQTWPLGSQAQP